MQTLIGLNNTPPYLDFYEQIQLLCKKICQETPFLTVGFLACDFKSAGLTKMLQDEEFWLTLNEITDQKIAIFYLKEKHKRPPVKNKKSKKKTCFDTRYNQLFPVGISNRKDAGNYIDNLLTKAGYNSYNKPTIPFLIFFNLKEDTLGQSFIIKLHRIRDHENIFYEELKRIFQAVLKHLPDCEKNPHPDPDTVYNQIRMGTKDCQIVKWSRILLQVAVSVKTLAPS